MVTWLPLHLIEQTIATVAAEMGEEGTACCEAITEIEIGLQVYSGLTRNFCDNRKKAIKYIACSGP